ncbi:MAG TPA: RNA methyltransferase [Longimicrobium sp.]
MLSRREERLLRSLRQRKTREAEGLFLAEGIRAVEDLAASALPVRLAVAASTLGDSARGRALLDVLAAKGIAVHQAGERELAALADTETPQGILAVAPIPSATLDDLSADAEPAVVVVLDAVQDPGNFGTLARTAEALGASGLVALPGTVDPWNPKSVRAAMGSTFRLSVVPADWDTLSPWLSSRGFQTLAAAPGGEPLPDPRPPRAALVLGNEGAGIGDDTRARADRVVGIPIRGRAESLNVAAAGAILLYELLR